MVQRTRSDHFAGASGRLFCCGDPAGMWCSPHEPAPGQADPPEFQLLRDHLRHRNNACRYGGEGFAVLLCHCAAEQARQVA